MLFEIIIIKNYIHFTKARFFLLQSQYYYSNDHLFEYSSVGIDSEHIFPVSLARGAQFHKNTSHLPRDTAVCPRLRPSN